MSPTSTQLSDQVVLCILSGLCRGEIQRDESEAELFHHLATGKKHINVRVQ
jgi:hypothetical protein